MVEKEGEIRKIKESIILSSKTCRYILIYLNKKDFDYALNVSRNIKCTWSDAMNNFRKLKEEGIIEIIKNKGKNKYPFVYKDNRRKYFRLTDKGKKIAKLLLGIEKETTPKTPL